jgi:hypothetical protein
MNKVIAKNRSGWILHEYISIPEEELSDYPNVTGSYAIVKVGDKDYLGSFVYSEGDEMSKIHLWDLKEDIGYVDELDVAIINTIETQSRIMNCG